ncbi:hypothetical protein C3942_16645 [Solimonas fluminis]|uniref:Uncharacterized protein n=1 Tax=Solimonas fluminis TaxID=2086571 RepID=A0A2S5TCF3_9GAMM|nr:hypothetical protein [Solimonas fluminis]PPE72680.1 hypothetical protein C3942_16645 [Solimonas fluminis]
MKYLLHVGLPAVLQVALTLFVMFATRGNGSFVGLAAMLLGVWAIPVTAIVNFARARATPRASATFWISLPVPLLLMLMLLASVSLRL